MFEAYLINIILYLITGFLAGTMAGLLGIGGGIIIVPALSYIFSYSSNIPSEYVMHVAAGTSLASMVVTAQASVRAHYRHGRILWSVYKLMLPGLVLGAVVGVLVADIVGSNLLKMVFGVLLIFVATRMVFFSATEKGPSLPDKGVLVWASTVIGVLSGMLGLGGGALVVPFLAYYNMHMRNTAGIGSLCSLTIASIGSVACIITGLNEPGLPNWCIGYVYLPAVVAIVAASQISAPIAARWVYRLPMHIPRYIFALILAAMACHMLLF